MPRQVKDLRPRRSVTTSREDCGSTTSPESGSESLLHDDGDTESDRSPKEKAGEEADPPSSCRCEEAPDESDRRQATTFVIRRSVERSCCRITWKI